jgi:hypothetical protein
MRGGPPAWVLGEVLTTPLRKKCMLRITHERCFLWRQNNPEVNYSPIRISGEGVFLEEVSRSRKMAGTCGYGEELSSSINAGNFMTSGKVYC